MDFANVLFHFCKKKPPSSVYGFLLFLFEADMTAKPYSELEFRSRKLMKGLSFYIKKSVP